MVSPLHMRAALLDLIDREARHAAQGQPARIAVKVNALVDPEVIRALYRASQAGVQVDLLIRGICCLRPACRESGERIRVISIVDRFLEHARCFYFEAGGRQGGLAFVCRLECRATSSAGWRWRFRSRTLGSRRGSSRRCCSSASRTTSRPAACGRTESGAGPGAVRPAQPGSAARGGAEAAAAEEARCASWNRSRWDATGGPQAPALLTQVTGMLRLAGRRLRSGRLLRNMRTA